MTKPKKMILVTSAPASSGLAYFYSLALRDICRMPTVLIDNGQASYSRTFAGRVAMRLRLESGLAARSQFQRISEAMEGSPEQTAVVLFNLGCLRAGQLASLNQAGANLYAYIPDSPFGLPPRNWHALRDVLPLFKSIFTFLGDLVPVYYQYGARRVRRIPFAYCRYTHLRNEASIRGSDGHLYYFGTYGPLIEKWLAPLTRFNLVIHGHDWEHAGNPELRAAARHAVAIDRNMAETAGGQLVINFVRAQHGAGHSMKTFELPAAGACVISNRTKEQTEFFPEESNVGYFDTASEMENLVRGFVENPDKIAQKISLRRKYLMNQSYHERARILLEELEDGSNA